MKRPSKIPVSKSTKAAPKKVATSKTAAPKDAAAQKPSPAPKSAAPRPRDPRLPAPGTKLTRAWREKTYQVAVGDETFAYAGKTFTSLSALAREITGASSLNGYLWFGLSGATKPGKGAKATKPVEPKIGGESNDLGTLAGQRAALATAGIAKRGRPIGRTASKGSEGTPPTAPSKPLKGTPEQVASAAKARAARAAKKAERTAR